MNYFLKFSLFFITLFSVQSCMEFDVNEEMANENVIFSTQEFYIDNQKYIIDSTNYTTALKYKKNALNDSIDRYSFTISGYNEENSDEEGKIYFTLYTETNQPIKADFTAINSIDEDDIIKANTYELNLSEYEISNKTESPLSSSFKGFGSLNVEDQGNEKFDLKLNKTYENDVSSMVEINAKFSSN